MSKHHEKVKLIVGFIFADDKRLKKAESVVSDKLGPQDHHSNILDFSHTQYYREEFGRNLKRKFISIKRLASIEEIYKIKKISNRIEKYLSIDGKRTVNIDPGYITLGKLVLLTTKDHGHRVYLKDGIYGESTLKFYNGSYAPWPTTYPDYATKEHIGIFNNIRSIYKNQLVNR